MFGTFPGVQNYCQGGNSPKRCTNNQAMSCATISTHDVCGNGGWCEPLQCTTPSGPECSAGDTCPQITTGKCFKAGSGTICPATGAYIPLVEENPNTINPDVGHTQAAFLQELYRGKTSAAMEWYPGGPGTQGGMAYFRQADVPDYYQLAATYGLADNHFSTMGGPSQPNHAYLFAASSGEWSDNPAAPGMAQAPILDSFLGSIATGTAERNTADHPPPTPMSVRKSPRKPRIGRSTTPGFA
jgi:hypothetical protein